MKNIIKWGEPIIQTVISVLLLALLISSGLLPGKYLGIAVVIVLLLLALTFLTARSRNIAARSAGAIIAVIVCIVLVVATVYLRQIVTSLNRMAGADTQIQTLAVLVRADDPAQSLADTAGYRFGLYEGVDGEIMPQMLAEIGQETGGSADGTGAGSADKNGGEGAGGSADAGGGQEIGGSAPESTESGEAGAGTAENLQIQEMESSLDLAEALLAGGVDAAVCNKAYIAILDDAIEDFSGQIRVLYEKEFETQIASGEDLFTITGDGRDSGAGEGEAVKSAKVWDLTKEPFTVLISGIDVSGPISTTSRSDVNILMTVNPTTHKILLSTTPRDYFVYIPGISGDKRDKLTHAGVYGVRYSMRTLENLYGIGISDYIRINFDSLVRLVDALGGVDVVSEYDFSSGSYHYVKGINHLNGDQALSFSRNRYSFEDGDNQRGRNQMLVLTAIIDKLQSPALLKNPGQVLDVIAESMQTSITTRQITKVIAWQLEGAYSWQIDRQSASGEGDAQQTYSMPGTDLYVMWPDEASVSEVSGRIRETMR